MTTSEIFARVSRLFFVCFIRFCAVMFLGLELYPQALYVVNRGVGIDLYFEYKFDINVNKRKELGRT